MTKGHQRWTRYVSAGIAIALVAGCSDRDRARVNSAAERAGAAAGEAVEGLKGAKQSFDSGLERTRMGADRVRDFTFERREELRQDAEQRLNEMDRKVASLDDKTRQARADAVRRYEDAKSDVQQSMERIGSATEANWDQVRQTIGQAWDRMEAAYQQAVRDST